MITFLLLSSASLNNIEEGFEHICTCKHHPLSPFGSVLGRQDPETEAQTGLKTSKGALEVCGTVIVHTDQGDGGPFF